MNVNFDLSGFDDYDKLLRGLPQKVSNRVSQQAVTAALRKKGVPAIVAAAPVGTGARSPSSAQYGPLSSNIKVERMKSGNKKSRKASRVWTTSAFWGHFYELGTKDAEFGTYRQPPRPWFQPAIIAASSAIFAELARELDVRITKEYLR